MTPRSGIGEELGVYDALIACVDDSDVWLEYGIIEHRYKLAHPSAYTQMVQRWGHTSKAPTKYSASSFLGGCLRRLKDEGAISTKKGRPTGYWARYLSVVTLAAGVPSPTADAVLSWHVYATQEGLDSYNWNTATS